VLRRLDSVLEATKDAVLVEQAGKQQAGINPEPFLLRKASQSFYNISLLDMKKLMGDQPDSSLRDTENVPLHEDVESYFKREVLPHAHDAWIDHDKTRIGYEIPFNRHFYVFEPPRPLAEIDADLKQCTDRILTMIQGLSA